MLWENWWNYHYEWKKGGVRGNIIIMGGKRVGKFRGIIIIMSEKI